jgi:AcrR family transcriptional regulator
MATVSDVREQLVEAGMRVVERDGLPALSARKLAAETGTSTMAVYTHFGGMNGVVDAIAREAFVRFTRALTEVEQTDDPVADFVVMGWRYREFALANPQRYQMMFGTSSPPSLAGYRTDLIETGNPTDRAEWTASFEALRKMVRRMVAEGRIRDDGESGIAGRIWSVIHGVVMLEMAGFFGHEGHGATEILAPLIVDFLVGMGDERERTDQSLAAAVTRITPLTASGEPGPQ